MYFSDDTLALAGRVVAAARATGAAIATAESCTGGLIGGAITEVSGASHVFMRGFVTYANEAKTEMLGVEAGLIARHGAVSEEVARAMAEGALRAARVTVAVSVTGIAGPGGGEAAFVASSRAGRGGGSAHKPVGLVHVAVARTNGATLHERHVFAGDRAAVRAQAVAAALRLLLRALGETA